MEGQSNCGLSTSMKSSQLQQTNNTASNNSSSQCGMLGRRFSLESGAKFDIDGIRQQRLSRLPLLTTHDQMQRFC
ncbi:hypothetical protein TNCV_2377871 [Trichonephila clavipes]|nr:hypothetical protein TNCV_2377871 [Trichonephila clavipes]